MQATIELGVEFIWIDALCIIQDDLGDWKEQASQIGTIYKNALLTISAAASNNIASGLFVGQRNQTHKLKSHLSATTGVDIYARKACKQTHVGLFEHVVALGEGHQEHKLLPVVSRGWIFQERVQSRRILHCGPEELAWECRSGEVQCECSSTARYGSPQIMYDLKENYRPIPVTKRIISDRLLKRKGPLEPWDLTNHSLREWQELLVDYSCQFTYPTERQVALEGIATDFGSFDLGPYFYGLWGDNLHLQLDWVFSYTIQERKRLEDLPTWSWASIYNKCHYFYHPFSPDYECLSRFEIVKLPIKHGGDPDPSSGKTLVISSNAVDATIQFEKDVVPSFSPNIYANINGDVFHIFEDIQQSPAVSEWADLPADDRLVEGQDIVCAELSSYCLPSYPVYVKVLLVLCQSDRDVYKRVGVVFISRELDRRTAAVPDDIQRVDQRSRKRVLQIV